MPKNLFFVIVLLPAILYAVFFSSDEPENNSEPEKVEVNCLLSHNNKCFFDPKGAITNLTWARAKMHCRESNGYLAKKEQVLPVIEELKQYYKAQNSSISHLWTNDSKEDSPYAWVEHFDGGGSNWATQNSDSRNYVSFVCTR